MERHNIVFAFRYLGKQLIFSHALRDIYKTIKTEKDVYAICIFKKWDPRTPALYLA